MKKLSIIALTATAFMLSGAIAQNASMKPTIIRHENKVLRAEDATKHSVKAAGMHFWNQGWLNGGGITLDLETIEGDNGFGVFSSVEMLTPDIKTEQYDPYGNPLAFEYGPEGYGKGLAYNRTKGTDYTGRMYKVPKGMSFKMGAAWQGVNDYVDHTFTISEDAYFICNLAAGGEGAFEVLQNPTDITLNLEDMSLELNAKTKLTATPVGETNAAVHYLSSILMLQPFLPMAKSRLLVQAKQTSLQTVDWLKNPSKSQEQARNINKLASKSLKVQPLRPMPEKDTTCLNLKLSRSITINQKEKKSL